MPFPHPGLQRGFSFSLWSTVQTQRVLFVTAEVPSHTPSLTAHRDQHPDPPWLGTKNTYCLGDVFTSLLHFLADCASYRRSPTSIKYSRSLDERYNLVSVQNAMEEFKLRAGHCESRKSLDLVSLPVSLYSHTGMTGKIPTLEQSPTTLIDF